MRSRAHQRPLQLPALRGFGPGLGGPGDRDEGVPYGPASGLGATNPVPLNVPLNTTVRVAQAFLRRSSLWQPVAL